MIYCVEPCLQRRRRFLGGYDCQRDGPRPLRPMLPCSEQRYSSWCITNNSMRGIDTIQSSVTGRTPPADELHHAWQQQHNSSVKASQPQSDRHMSMPRGGCSGSNCKMQ